MKPLPLILIAAALGLAHPGQAGFVYESPKEFHTQGDLTGDGLAGGADYLEVLSCWGQAVSMPEEMGPPVPEPATMGFLLLGGLALLKRPKCAKKPCRVMLAG